MTKRGRKPKPTAVKKANGNPGRRPLPENEPLPNVMTAMPSPPSFLDATAKRHWKTYGAELLEIGVLTKADLPAFSVYCTVYSNWLKSHKQTEKDGDHTFSNNGQAIYNPSAIFRDKAIAQMMKFWTEFGMTPSARTGIKVTTPKKDDGDALDNLIKFGNGY